MNRSSSLSFLLKLAELNRSFCSKVRPPIEGLAFIGADDVIDKELRPEESPLESPLDGADNELAPLIALRETDLSA